MSIVSSGITLNTAYNVTGDLTGNLIFQSNGTTEAVRIDTNQNVGIGTTNPGQKLEVNGWVRTGIGASATGGLELPYYSGSASSRTWRLRNDVSSYGDFSIAQATTQGGATFSDKLYIDSTGNVGIGTSSLTTKLQVYGGSIHVDRAVGGGASQLLMTFGASSGGNFGQISNTGTYWALGYGSSQSTVGTQSVVWDSSGNVGIGTTGVTIDASAGLFPGITPKQVIQTGSASNSYQRLILIQNPSAETGSETLARVGIKLGLGGESNTGNSNKSAVIYAESTSAYNNGTSLCFASSNSERMRITAGGYVLIGKTTSGAGVVGLEYEGSGGALLVTRASNPTALFNRQGSSGINIQFRFQDADCGSISVNTGSTAYNTSSDYRLKNSIVPMTGALAKVAQLKPITYKWNADDSYGEGFIAHELAEVCPLAVHGEKDAVDENGKIVPQGIDTSFLVATLTAAIQELKAIVDAQAIEIAELKGKA